MSIPKLNDGVNRLTRLPERRFETSDEVEREYLPVQHLKRAMIEENDAEVARVTLDELLWRMNGQARAV